MLKFAHDSASSCEVNSQKNFYHEDIREVQLSKNFFLLDIPNGFFSGL